MTDLERSDALAGSPDIPVIRIINADISSVKVSLISEETLKLDKKLYPRQLPVRKENADFTISFDRASYSSNSMIYKDVFKIKNNNTVEIYPYDYIPTADLLIIRKIEYSYSLAMKKSSGNKTVAIYDDIFSLYTDSLRDYYLQRGFLFESFPLSICGSTNTEIDNFIENEYAGESFSHLLLIGNSSALPYFTGSGIDYPATDLYYSLMDTNDYFPDVILSRLPFNQPSELSDYLFKVKTEYAGGKPDYADKVYFIASNDGYYHTLVESTHAYSMGRLRGLGYECDSLFGYYSTGMPIDKAVEEGREIAVYSGHGAAFYWVGPSFDSDDIESLDNYALYPSIVSFACLTGNYSYNDFFGYFWLKNSLNGATSFIGSSQYTYWEEDDFLQRAFIDSLSASSSIIEAMNKAKINFYKEYGDVSMTRGYFERYNYFSLPEIYAGSKNISSYVFACDKYQPSSSGMIEASASFNGELDESGFTGVFFEGVLGDSVYFNNSANVQFDIAPLSAVVGDSLLITDYVPGLFFGQRYVKLIKDGYFVSLSSYELSNFSIDTFHFDLNFKNYGNSSSDSSHVIVGGLDDSLFNIISSEIRIGPLMSDSSITVTDGLVIEINGYSDSALSPVCSLFTVTGGDTVCEIIELDLLKPDFEVAFNSAVIGEDTTNSVVLGAYSRILLSITNLSSLKSKDIKIKLTSPNIVCADSIKTIDSLSFNESIEVFYDIFAFSSSQPVCSLTAVLSLGGYSDTTLIIVPTSFKNSSMYLGPINGYYIYTNEMTDFENSPLFEEIDIDSHAFRQLEVKDDTTICVKLPFEVHFAGESRDSIFFNTNGILSLFDIQNDVYMSEPLPTSYLSNPSIFTGWLDYRCEYYDDVFVKPSDAVNTVFSYFDTTNYRYVIYYNKVKAGESNYTFAVSLDTAEVTLYYIDIPDSNSMIIGMQFDSQNYLSFSYDTSETTIKSVRNNLAVKFSPFAPILKNKFTQMYEMKFTLPHLDSPALIERKSNLRITFNESSYYEVYLYDISGRLNEMLYSGLTPKSTLSFHPNMTGGVFFLVIKNNDRVVLTKKLTVF